MDVELAINYSSVCPLLCLALGRRNNKHLTNSPSTSLAIDDPPLILFYFIFFICTFYLIVASLGCFIQVNFASAQKYVELDKRYGNRKRDNLLLAAVMERDLKQSEETKCEILWWEPLMTQNYLLEFHQLYFIRCMQFIFKNALFGCLSQISPRMKRSIKWISSLHSEAQ